MEFFKKMSYQGLLILASSSIYSNKTQFVFNSYSNILIKEININKFPAFKEKIKETLGYFLSRISKNKLDVSSYYNFIRNKLLSTKIKEPDAFIGNEKIVDWTKDFLETKTDERTFQFLCSPKIYKEQFTLINAYYFINNSIS